MKTRNVRINLDISVGVYLGVY